MAISGIFYPGLGNLPEINILVKIQERATHNWPIFAKKIEQGIENSKIIHF